MGNGAVSTTRAVFWLGAGVVLLLALAILVSLVEGYRLSAAASIALLAIVVFARPHASRYVDRHFRLLGGAIAERRVGETLEELRSERWVVMHDVERQYEGNIDHLDLHGAGGGVYLVDTEGASLGCTEPRISLEGAETGGEGPMTKARRLESTPVMLPGRTAGARFRG